MILLKKVRLINWYGFADETAPIGFFTLIAGKNGNGKSVMLDAIKYAAYGDTVFNKSSDNKSSRTLSSYTRGLLDATAGTYMRPADRMPYVYSHIALEYYDDIEEMFFVLGAVIETSPSNNCHTLRYAADHLRLDQLELTYRENSAVIPFTAAEIQKKYGLILMNREQGLMKFMQMTGLKLNLGQLPTYLRKLRGIMTYNPDARIDQFIRESVLEQKDVDFEKLITAKGNIEKLNESFQVIEQELGELDDILEEYDGWESDHNRLVADDIRMVYKKIGDLRKEIDHKKNEQILAERTIESLNENLEILNNRKKDTDDRLVQAKVSLDQLDSTRMIAEEKKRYESLEAEKKFLLSECRKLEHFQEVVSEMIVLLGVEDTKVEFLTGLCRTEYSGAEKAAAVTTFRKKIDVLYDEFIKQTADADSRLNELNKLLDRQQQIIEECTRHQNSYSQIPEYVGLRDEINKEFARRKIPSQARFACEYVIELKNEEWREALEAYLGPRRYTILVEPQYYDIADDILNHSEHRYGHLFNTKLLMKKKIVPEEDAAVFLLEIKNPIAQKYFNYQLGRMHAVAMCDVKNYENAISKEGRVSIGMDSFFLRSDSLRSYYLGQKIFELNRIRAQKEADRLQAEKKEVLRKKYELEEQKNRLKQDREFFKEYDYDAHKKYQSVSERSDRSKRQLIDLSEAQKNNSEFIELNQLVGRLEEEHHGLQKTYSQVLGDKARQDTILQQCKEKISEKTHDMECQKEKFREYEKEFYTLVQKTVDAYNRYVQNDRKGPGGLLQDDRKKRIIRHMKLHEDMLRQKQAEYNIRYPGQELPGGTKGREIYASRRERIWMDDLQEIRQKLDAQTKLYEEIFKNEFVLTILKSCEKAKDDLKQINGELFKLHFASRYQFDIHFVHDGSEYEKIIQYAKYLDEREQLGGTAGQRTLGGLTSISDEEGEQLEEEMNRIINRIIAANSREMIERFADYRNYMTYEILVSNQVLDRAKLSRQTGYNSGAEVQIPYLLILSSALLLIYNQRVNSTRLVFIDEPFVKMDAGNIRQMLAFMRRQNLQVIFCAPDKIETIGNECEVILPTLRVSPEVMRLGVIQFHEDRAFTR